MRNKLLSLGFLLLSRMITRIIPGQHHEYRNMAKFKMQLGYLKGVKTCRSLCLSFVGAVACLILVVSGIIIFNVSFFAFSPYSAEFKMWIGLLSSVVYLGAAAAIFLSVFTEERWLEIFHAQDLGQDALEASSEEHVKDLNRR